MSNLQEAFREAARREFAMVPVETELDYVFSRKFERKMRRIIRAQVHGYWLLVNTAAKRVAVAVAIIVILLTSAMAIKPIRERVIKFFVDVYEDYFEIHFGEEESWDLPEKTEPMTQYTLTELPEGYEIIECIVTQNIIRTQWRNDLNNNIFLNQETGTHEIILNNTNEATLEIIHNGTVVQYQNNNGIHCFIWEFDNYFFLLNIYDDLTMEQMLNIVASLEKE